MNRIFFSILIVFSTTTSAFAFGLKNSQTEISGIGAWSGDYDGFGIAIKSGIPFSKNNHHYLEIEGVFAHLGSDEQSFSSQNVPLHPLFPVITQVDSGSSVLDEYFLFLNYKYQNQLPLTGQSNLFYFSGVGLGMAYLDLDGQVRIEKTQASIDYLNVSTHKLTGAGQIFGGVGYSFSNSFSLYIGGKVIVTDKTQFRTGTRKNALLASTDAAQLMLEAGFSIRW